MMQTPAMLPESLKAQLGVDETASLRAVNESLINQTYCLISEHERFLVKRFLADQSTGRSRRLLFTIQKKLASFKIAPEPLYLCDKTGYYVEEWISPSLTPLSVLPDAQRIQVLATTLAKIHALPITTTKIDLPLQWDGYINAAKLSDSDSRVKRAKELVFLAAASINSAADLVFCHNDLAMSHVVNYQQLRVIDWEYCSTGNRYFDLASTIAINRLSAQQCGQLIAQYAHVTGIDMDIVQDGVTRHEPLVSVTYQLWYAAITEHVKRIQ